MGGETSINLLIKQAKKDEQVSTKRVREIG